ncbi:Aldehyde/histidinol dehydrogenase [Trichoderma chlorosporum]
MSTPETNLFINGELVSSLSGKTLPIYNPATEEKVADVSEADAEDVDVAVAVAENAFPAWRGLSTIDRINKCLTLADLIERDELEIAALDAQSVGIPISINHFFIHEASRDIRDTAGLAHDIHGETILNTPGQINLTLKQPYGVCAAILAWNAPTVIFAAKVIPCVVAGNTIVVKSSEKAPLSILKLGELIAEAGFPPGVINILSGFGHTVGAALSNHMKIRKVTFTGSTRAGKLIQEAAAKSNLKSVALEMGSKTPLIVFPDCNVEEAATSAATNLKFNSGQICISNSRVYAHQDIFPQFLKIFSEKFAQPEFANPLDRTTSFGPQADKLQGTHTTEKGYYIQPTVFAKVPATVDISHEEVFGPVAVIQEFETEEEVIAECNKTEYGLYAGVYTKDISRAYRVATALETGMVAVNSGGGIGAYDLPFGGWKQSGNGRELGKLGLEEFYKIKTVMIQL